MWNIGNLAMNPDHMDRFEVGWAFIPIPDDLQHYHRRLLAAENTSSGSSFEIHAGGYVERNRTGHRLDLDLISDDNVVVTISMCSQELGFSGIQRNRNSRRVPPRKTEYTLGNTLWLPESTIIEQEDSRVYDYVSLYVPNGLPNTAPELVFIEYGWPIEIAPELITLALVPIDEFITHFLDEIRAATQAFNDE